MYKAHTKKSRQRNRFKKKRFKTRQRNRAGKFFLKADLYQLTNSEKTKKYTLVQIPQKLLATLLFLST